MLGKPDTDHEVSVSMLAVSSNGNTMNRLTLESILSYKQEEIQSINRRKFH